MRVHDRTAALATLLALSLSCSGGSSSPSNPTPSPSPTAALPSPSTAPSTTPTPSTASCPYGKGTPDTFCAKRVPSLLGDVDTAINRLVQQHPEYFNVNDTNGPDGYKVLKPAEYEQGVMANLQSAAFCTELNGNVLSVRKGTEFSEDFDILLSTGHIRRGNGSYLGTCTPPSFPLDAADVIAYVRVAFYSIRCADGITVPHNADEKLPIGCTGLITASPKTKDNLDVNERLVGSRIDWTLEQEGEHVLINDFPDQPFNKIATPLNPGHYTLCATVKAVQGCQHGEVEPDPRQ
jgi:hypothetical protein